ncbi:Imm8 family immunity protein [Micromonospora sp. NPDC049051]|uniref:Imm8 family immunity protein n=1 Tax=unclassified Micromonospora TaxID=2617518 RepID=UPI00372128E3
MPPGPNDRRAGGGDRGDSFDLMVCTPVWLDRRTSEAGPIVGRRYLLVDRFDPRKIAEFPASTSRVAGSGGLGGSGREGRPHRDVEFEDYGEH